MLDANVVIRYLIKDSIEQSNISAEIISNNKCILTLEILCEVVYVLQSKRLYCIPRQEIVYSIKSLSSEIIIEKWNIVNWALKCYQDNPKLDFVDCILYGYKKNGFDVISFDKRLNKEL